MNKQDRDIFVPFYFCLVGFMLIVSFIISRLL